MNNSKVTKIALVLIFMAISYGLGYFFKALTIMYGEFTILIIIAGVISEILLIRAGFNRVLDDEEEDSTNNN